MVLGKLLAQGSQSGRSEILHRGGVQTSLGLGVRQLPTPGIHLLLLAALPVLQLVKAALPVWQLSPAVVPVMQGPESPEPLPQAPEAPWWPRTSGVSRGGAHLSFFALDMCSLARNKNNG